MAKICVVHYVNQFFAGIGGEEKAETRPHIAEALPPISLNLQKQLGDEFEVVGTVVCGDSYFNENLETAKKEVMNLIQSLGHDLVIAGPAFNAGRYGMACGQVVEMVGEAGIKAFTAMYEENPGVDVFKKNIYILPTSDSAAGMRKAIPDMVAFSKKMVSETPLGSPADDGYMPRGIRVNKFVNKRGSQRAVDMLIKKLKGEEFKTEYPMPNFDRVTPGKAIVDITKAKIAVVTSGGIVPKGNPDRIESSSAQKYGKYAYPESGDLDKNNSETAHGGYDPVYANEDCDRVVPLDVLLDLEKEGKIGSLFPYYYSTVGNGTAVASSKAYAAEIAQDLLSNGVEAVILTSTWGTCTRCGATMVKEIERTGLPVVHMCTVVPISLTVGANRIIPTVAIPYPLGNPTLEPEGEKSLRRDLVEKALKALETEVQEQTVFEN